MGEISTLRARSGDRQLGRALRYHFLKFSDNSRLVSVSQLNTAKNIVYLGFILGVILTFYFSTNYSDLISIRIAIGSGTAFIVAQLIDVNIFDKLRYKIWFAAPLTSSLVGSAIDTFLFFSISFYGTGINWVTLSFGDLFVKIFVALAMLIPFRLLLSHIQENSIAEKKISV